MNKDKKREQNKRYYEKNKEREHERYKKWYEKNKEKRSQYNKQYIHIRKSKVEDLQIRIDKAIEELKLWQPEIEALKIERDYLLDILKGKDNE